MTLQVDLKNIRSTHLSASPARSFIAGQAGQRAATETPDHCRLTRAGIFSGKPNLSRQPSWLRSTYPVINMEPTWPLRDGAARIAKRDAQISREKMPN